MNLRWFFFKEKFLPGFKEILEYIKYYLRVEKASIETTLIYYLENETFSKDKAYSKYSIALILKNKNLKI